MKLMTAGVNGVNGAKEKEVIRVKSRLLIRYCSRSLLFPELNRHSLNRFFNRESSYLLCNRRAKMLAYIVTTGPIVSRLCTPTCIHDYIIYTHAIYMLIGLGLLKTTYLEFHWSAGTLALSHWNCRSN